MRIHSTRHFVKAAAYAGLAAGGLTVAFTTNAGDFGSWPHIKGVVSAYLGCAGLMGVPANLYLALRRGPPRPVGGAAERTPMAAASDGPT